jgi:hypothetical protein
MAKVGMASNPKPKPGTFWTLSWILAGMIGLSYGIEFLYRRFTGREIRLGHNPVASGQTQRNRQVRCHRGAMTLPLPPKGTLQPGVRLFFGLAD